MKSAVEWLIQEIEALGDAGYAPEEAVEILGKKAKEMEKKQRIMDYEMGYINGSNQKKITGEQYLNE